MQASDHPEIQKYLKVRSAFGAVVLFGLVLCLGVVGFTAPPRAQMVSIQCVDPAAVPTATDQFDSLGAYCGPATATGEAPAAVQWPAPDTTAEAPSEPIPTF
ncbi:MAG: hypothetical protein ABIQ72_00095 [Usitatibacter sp.]